MQNNLGNTYAERIRGERADNLEKAIAAYDGALTVFARAATPLEWAQAPTNLGNAYADRIRGDRGDNLENAIGAHEKALTVFTRNASPRKWAETQNNLAVTYRDRIRGDRADNLERAIKAHEMALTVFTRETLPREWADTQNNLGNAYGDRIRGDHADNIEKAITHLLAALTVRTREAQPGEWGDTQNNLGNAYQKRIRDDPADNMEKAIAAYEATLTVTTSARPQDWAETQNNLAVPYLHRIGGDRAANVEKTIAHLEAALRVRTREAFPRQWAESQDNLGNAYAARIAGDRIDNLENAIAAREAALTVFARESLPEQWITQSNLANTYLSRIRGDREENVERAIAIYQGALRVFTREALPQRWASTQADLGHAYAVRIRGDRADNLEKSIAAYQAALTVFTREALPRDWASSQNGLGNAYGARVRGERGENLEKAIDALEAALKVRTREAFPSDWAKTQNNLAIIYRARIRGVRADNLHKAITKLESALTVLSREAYPFEHLNVGRLLGTALMEARDWKKARSVLLSARAAFLISFGQGLNEAAARDLMDQTHALFTEAAYAAVQEGDLNAALDLLIEGKGRLMSVALKLHTLDLVPEQRDRLETLRREIREQTLRIELVQGLDRSKALERVAVLRVELLSLVEAASRIGNLTGGALQLASALLPEGGGAIAAPIITKVGGKLLIVLGSNHGNALHSINLPELTTTRLNALMRGDGSSRVGAAGGWLGAYNINYLPTEDRSKRWSEWVRAIEDLGPRLWSLVGDPLQAALKELKVNPGARLFWVPAGALGILPLGLAQDPGSKRRLGDDYEIVYAPNLEALSLARREIANPRRATLAAIINPTEDLDNTEKEGTIVASYFPSDARTVLQRKSATPGAVLDALKGKTHWHFASHGTFSWRDARRSGLIMHGNEILTVGQLLDSDGLGGPRLVVLSACETGLYEIDRNPDEFVGLPGTFTALGAVGVLATLWPVSDAATALLIAKFYELHMGQGVAPATALHRAQVWLRSATNQDLQAYTKVAVAERRLEARQLVEIEEELSFDGLRRSKNRAIVEWIPGKTKPTVGQPTPEMARPYAHPYFWAGFVHTGL